MQKYLQIFTLAWTIISGLILLASGSDALAQEEERDSPLCQRLTLKDIESMPGWEKLKQHVQLDLGVPIETIQVNRDEKPDHNAYICSNKSPPQYGKLTGGPCTRTNNKLNGALNTDGVLSLSITTGNEIVTTIKVKQQVDYGHSLAMTFSVISTMNNINSQQTWDVVPGIVSVNMDNTISLSGSITNAKDISLRKKRTSLMMSTVSIMPRFNEVCTVIVQQDVCSIHTEMTPRITASGWIWFLFKEKRKGSREWGYNIESILTLEERSVDVELGVKMDVTLYGNYSTECVCEKECEPHLEREVFPIGGELGWADDFNPTDRN